MRPLHTGKLPKIPFSSDGQKALDKVKGKDRKI